MKSIYSKKYTRKYSFLLKKNFVKSFYSNFLCENECGKMTNSLPRKIFSSNQLTAKFFSKRLIWRKFCDKTVTTVKFHNFHWGKKRKCFSKRDAFTKFLWKKRLYKINWFHGNFLPAEKFQQLTKCFKKSVNLAACQIKQFEIKTQQCATHDDGIGDAVWKRSVELRH